jgi:hypothetical protein
MSTQEVTLGGVDDINGTRHMLAFFLHGLFDDDGQTRLLGRPQQARRRSSIHRGATIPGQDQEAKNHAQEPKKLHARILRPIDAFHSNSALSIPTLRRQT